MKKQTTNIVILLLVFLLVAAVGVIAWLLTRPREAQGMEPNIVALEPTPEDEQVPEGIQIPGYPSLSVDAATGMVAVVFENPGGNPCTFELTLTRTDTDEVLWQSDAFKPGTGIQNPVLTTIPAPGTYPAALSYTTKSLEDGTPMNGAVVNTEITVQ